MALIFHCVAYKIWTTSIGIHLLSDSADVFYQTNVRLTS